MLDQPHQGDHVSEMTSLSPTLAAAAYVLAPDGSSGGRYLDVSRPMALLMGYDSPAQMLDQVQNVPAQVYVEPDRFAELMARLEQKGEVDHFVSEVYGRDGQVLVVSERCRAERDEAGRIGLVHGGVCDVTAATAREEASDTALTILQQTLDAIPDVVFLVDLQQVIVLCNQAFCRLVGREKEDILGRRGDEILGGFHEFLVSSGADLDSFDEAEPGTFFYCNLRTRYAMSLTPYYAPTGELIGTVHVCRDLSRIARELQG